ncbi:MAG: hypothetical protein ACU836_08660 [Gammaproteobacteria bacterium]
MTANLPVLNDLQREFATRAHDEVIDYILPWTRGPLRRASSLDTIYEALGQVPLDYDHVRSLIDHLQHATTQKYNKYQRTLTWLRDRVLNGDYAQQQNSCGAWSLAHWLMRKEHRYRGGHFFSTYANAEYRQVQFKIADGIALPGGLGIAFNNWLSPGAGGPYSSPWKIMQRLGIHTLKIVPAARAAANTANAPLATPLATKLNDMLTLVNALRPGGFPVVQDGNLNSLRAGEGAIIIAFNPAVNPPTLHYLLLGHTTRGWEIYNSNSHKLNPTILPNCPQFNTTFDTELLDNNGHATGTETWHFLGVFIAA